jgi:hypothetical protein
MERRRAGDKVAKHKAAIKKNMNPGKKGSAKPTKPSNTKKLPAIVRSMLFNW